MKPKLFIHIPKTGGTTIWRVNGMTIVGKKHLPPAHVSSLTRYFHNSRQRLEICHARWKDLGEKIQNEYQSFAIVRNPWDRTVSRFTYGKRKNIIPKKYPFKKFLEQRLENDRLYSWHQPINSWCQQKDYVTEANKLPCDIFRFEYYNDVLSYLNISKPIRIRRISNGVKDDNGTTIIGKKDYREFYDNESNEIIADWYEEDIKFFGFTFDGAAIKNIKNIPVAQLDRAQVCGT